MVKLFGAVGSFFLVLLLGLVVWRVTSSATASYVVAVLAMAAAVAGLFLVRGDRQRRLTSKIKVRRARKGTVTGIDATRGLRSSPGG